MTANAQEQGEAVISAADPVRHIPADRDGGNPTSGYALCLSGGGYRAMLFHVGVLWRLNEASLLRRIDRISSVSGGSITAGVLAHRWHQLRFEGDVAANLDSCLVEPVRAMGRHSIDISSVVEGILTPFTSVSDRVVDAYRDHLFGDATLQDLPDEPRFVINATNLGSGVLMRFSKPYIADWRVGSVKNPTLPLAVAVAASSAFPPVLSPCTIDLRDQTWTTQEGNDLTGQQWRGKIRCSDGGVYDNLGLETSWKKCRTIIVSDAGGQMTPDPDPASDWARHTLRVLKVIDNQVRSLRKRQVIDAFRDNRRDGTYIGIRSHIADYRLPDPLPANPAVTEMLAAIATRLTNMDDERQELLINWGYTICDAGLRAHLDPDAPRGTLPYPHRPLSSAG